MTLCNYYDRLEIEDGELVRVITAVPVSSKKSHLSLDVYKECESGRCQCRNLYSSMWGYRVAFPGERTSLYSNGIGSFEQGLDMFSDVPKTKAFYHCSLGVDEDSRKLILGKYPEFKWVMKKWKGTLAQTMSALEIWKSHKDVEFVLAAGWTSIALNKSFWRLSERKRKEVVSFKRTHKDTDGWSLSDVQASLKYKASVSDYNRYAKFCLINGKVTYDVYRYLLKVGIADRAGVYLYRDYRKMLKQTDHDSDDGYWKYPKNLQAAHDKVLVEVEEKNASVQLKKLEAKQENYFKAVKKFLKYNAEIDGYSVFVPDTVGQIATQAKALHQCLVHSDYVSRVIDKSCVLVFVHKNGVPVATCQLLKGDKIGQFYADELDRNDCLPSEEVRAVMNKWIERKRSAA